MLLNAQDIIPVPVRDSVVFADTIPIPDSTIRNEIASTKDSVIYNDTVPGVKPDTVTIAGVGDIMLGTDYPSVKYLPLSGKCEGLLNYVLPLLLDADITFANIEGVFAGEHGNPKDCKNPDQCYVFRMPEQYVECLSEADFDLLSVANNHVNDFGYEGRKNSARVLEQAGLTFAGFIDKPWALLEKNGIRFGFAAFSPHSGTNNMLDTANVISVIRHLDTISDIVVVSFHGGAEGKDHQHVTRRDEIFLGHNRGNVYQFAHMAIDAGADIIFGHGPHITRAVEVYHDRFIAYSLGNFCTYSRFNLAGPNGIAPIIKVFADTTGRFIEAKIIPIYQEGEGIPKPDPEMRAVNKIRVLTALDFPDQQLIIEDSGLIYPVKK